jgi:Cu-processing system permease protein
MNRKIGEKPRTWSVVRAIAKVTFLEVLRDKILYNILICAVLLFSVGFLASHLTFIRPERVTLDFGMLVLNLSCSMIAIFTGASLIGREFERRTIYVTLSRPISRTQFVLGKFLGLAWVIVLNWAMLGLANLILILASGGNSGDVLSPAFFCGVVLILFQGMVLAGISILFSTFSTTSLSATLTIGFYLIGNSISEIRAVADRVNGVIGATLLRALAALLPNLQYFSLGNRVTYGLPVSPQFMATSMLYGVFLVAAVLALACLTIRGREI